MLLFLRYSAPNLTEKLELKVANIGSRFTNLTTLSLRRKPKHPTLGFIG